VRQPVSSVSDDLVWRAVIDDGQARRGFTDRKEPLGEAAVVMLLDSIQALAKSRQYGLR
jgi:hypothetical protein